MKIWVYYVVVLLILAVLFHCWWFCNDEKFGEIEIGKTFSHSRDGYYEKLPHNYCLGVDLGSKTSLAKIREEYNDIEWTSSMLYDNVILEGHFIKGFFTWDYLVLCEEKENDELQYLTFDFATEEVRYHPDETEICELINVDSIEWFVLCNTNEQIRPKH